MWAEWLHLIQDPAHWLFELTAEIPSWLLELAVLHRLLRWHDRREHSKEAQAE